MKGILILALIFLTVILLTNYFSTKTEPIEFKFMQTSSVGNIVSLKVPAVDEKGNGVITTLIVEAIPGKGRVLTDIKHLLFFMDTQNSIQIAKGVAEEITGIDTSKIDLIYQIETNASAIGGPSAGAALAIATIAAIENKTLNPKVGITGTINHGGSIGPVGGIMEKAKASKEAGIEIFLVPEKQGTEISYTPKRECKKIGPILYCTTEYLENKVDISKEVGIVIKEVSTIEEALKYFFE